MLVTDIFRCCYSLLFAFFYKCIVIRARSVAEKRCLATCILLDRPCSTQARADLLGSLQRQQAPAALATTWLACRLDCIAVRLQAARCPLLAIGAAGMSNAQAATFVVSSTVGWLEAQEKAL
jgi:hypothetical protein